MLQRLTLDGIELPRLYIAENKYDADLAMSKGIPFIRWTQGQEALIRILLRPVLERMFPHIKWNDVLGPKQRFSTKVTVYEDESKQPEMTERGIRLDERGSNEANDPTPWEAGILDEHNTYGIDEDGMITEHAVACSDERVFSGSGDGGMFVEHKLSLQDYVGDLSSCVDLNVLQRLRLMPAFLGNILDCIKLNAGSGLYWREGYNKRLGLAVGRYDASGQLPNLVILDVSGSIPRGISATMISLIDTLRTQLSADLIITSDISRFYPMGSELPNPNKIRRVFGYGNEATEFFGILENHIKGKHYGHVFSFGDNDTPDYYNRDRLSMPILQGTIVEHVHHYHTGTWLGNNKKGQTGYAKWCHMLAKKPLEEYDTSWCKVIRN